MVYAIKEINKGEEITTNYIRSTNEWRKRKRLLAEEYNFVCTCRLCELEQADPNYDKREALLKNYKALMNDEITDAKWFSTLKVLIQKVWPMTKIKANSF